MHEQKKTLYLEKPGRVIRVVALLDELLDVDGPCQQDLLHLGLEVHQGLGDVTICMRVVGQWRLILSTTCASVL